MWKQECEEVEEMSRGLVLRTRYNGIWSLDFHPKGQRKPQNGFKQEKEVITHDFEKRHTPAMT